MDFDSLSKSMRAASIEDSRRKAAMTDARIANLENRLAEMMRLIEQMQVEQVTTKRRTTKE